MLLTVLLLAAPDTAMPDIRLLRKNEFQISGYKTVPVKKRFPVVAYRIRPDFRPLYIR